MARILALVGAVLPLVFLTACGSESPEVSALAARPVDGPRLERFDAQSFATAIVAYPALGTEQDSNRKHVIPVGTYLASRVIDALPPGARDVSLSRFEARCVESHPVAPHAICSATMEVSIDGKARRVTIPRADLGNAHMILGPLQGTSEQPYIEKQVARLVDQLVAGLK
jgi:hypothetical protein